MATLDLERDGIIPDETLQTRPSTTDSSESSESISERSPLLEPENNRNGNYKSTETTLEEDQIPVIEGSSEEPSTPKAIAAVIGVLLVGTYNLSSDVLEKL